MESVKRTTEKSVDPAATVPAVRFTDYDPSARHPSSELLGYYHSSATRTYRTIVSAKLCGGEAAFWSCQTPQLKFI
jgi:hypothetical protein